MFFNESLRFFSEDAEPTEEVTEQEASSCKAAVEEEAEEVGSTPEEISESAATDALVADFMLESTEYYYNLREKMMNIEHVAALKANNGLYSESEMLLEAGWDTFKNKVVNFFKRLLALIKNLWAKFVNFIQSLTVREADVLNCDPNAAWKTYKQRMDGKEKLIRVRVYDIPFENLKALGENAKDLLDMVKAEQKTILDGYNGLKGKNDSFSTLDAYTAPEKLKDRIRARADKINQHLGAYFIGDGYGDAESKTTAIAKTEMVLSQGLFTDRVKYAKMHRNLLAQVKDCKQQAEKEIKTSIEEVQKKPKNDSQKKYQPKVISALRYTGNTDVKIFSKMTSLMKQVYRESIMIGRRVIGATKAKNASDKWDAMTHESFNMDRYFAL